MTIDERIQKQDTNDESTRLVLLHPDSGEVQAKATASAAALKEAQAVFGKSRQQVERALRDALADLDAGRLKKVVLNDLKEEPTEPLHFVAWYIYRDYKDISFGVVHYDLRRSTTGPDDVPTSVRNRLRFDTHKMLVSGNEEADRLLGVFKS